MPYILKGRKVLITGGSRGLGAAISAAFAREGASLALNYFSNAEAAQTLAHELKKKHNVQVVCVGGDVGQSESCRQIVKEAVEALGGLDIVISNAGWTEFSNFADLDSLSEEKWDKCWSVNVKGNLHIFKAAKPFLAAGDQPGAFIYTSSTAGKSVSGSSMSYCVTKAAALHLMKCLAQTQGPHIRVNSIIPGLMLTEWGKRYSPEFIDHWKKDNPLNSIPQIEECASMYVSLAKNLSVTGLEVPVDCGWLIAH